MRQSAVLLLACVALATMPVVSGQQPVALVPLEPVVPIVVDGVEILKVQGQVYMLVGAGGNVTVQVGDEGVLVADSGGPGQSEKILAAIRRLSPKAIRYLVNINGDADHVA